MSNKDTSDLFIVGYGVFEEASGEVSVCYYTNEFTEDEIGDNWYDTELEATMVALAVANKNLLSRDLVSYSGNK